MHILSPKNFPFAWANLDLHGSLTPQLKLGMYRIRPDIQPLFTIQIRSGIRFFRVKKRIMKLDSLSFT